jgi:AcrR family transcriptional regulator
MATPYGSFDESTPEGRVLAAAKRCVERWGFDKVTVDDIAAEAKTSRATLYRLFPGGRDVLFDQVRAKETLDFFTELDRLIGAGDSLDDLVVAVLVESTRALRADDQLQVMLASMPGEVLSRLGFADLPNIIESATAFLRPRVARYLDARAAAELAEILTRTVLSLFFTPSKHVDLADVDDARRYATKFILPAYTPIPTSPR